MRGSVSGAQYHLPGLHGRAEEDQAVCVAAELVGVREMVGAVW